RWRVLQGWAKHSDAISESTDFLGHLDLRLTLTGGELKTSLIEYEKVINESRPQCLLNKE
ncbi:MAG: hypothetical protein KC592_02835, partial [Nitrospira sp.]|nr:hypothetical protein [Nitrospira sp.]